MKFKFQERRCDVEHDKRLASFRNRGFCDVAKDILARQIAMSDARHKLHDYVTDRIKDHDDIDMKRIFITDSGVDAEIVENVEKLLRRYAGFEEIHHTLAGSTISGHCGPGCLGILYYNK